MCGCYITTAGCVATLQNPISLTLTGVTENIDEDRFDSRGQSGLTNCVSGLVKRDMAALCNLFRFGGRKEERPDLDFRSSDS